MERWIWVIPIVLAILSLLNKAGKSRAASRPEVGTARPAPPRAPSAAIPTQATRDAAAPYAAAAAYTPAEPRAAAPRHAAQHQRHAPASTATHAIPAPAAAPVANLVRDALMDAERARAAIVLAEVLAPPVALR